MDRKVNLVQMADLRESQDLVVLVERLDSLDPPAWRGLMDRKVYRARPTRAALRVQPV